MVLDLFKTFIRSQNLVFQPLINDHQNVRGALFYTTHAILLFSSALLVVLALQCSNIVLVFHAGLFVSSCSIFYQI